MVSSHLHVPEGSQADVAGVGHGEGPAGGDGAGGGQVLHVHIEGVGRPE